MLGLPEHVIPVTTIVTGYPDEAPGLTDRLPVEAVVHREKYRDYSDEDIDRLYAEKESSELTRKLLAENNMTTLARIFAEKRYPKKDNLLFSEKLLRLKKEKGSLTIWLFIFFTGTLSSAATSRISFTMMAERIFLSSCNFLLFAFRCPRYEYPFPAFGRHGFPERFIHCPCGIEDFRFLKGKYALPRRNARYPAHFSLFRGR